MNDITKIIKQLEDSTVLIDGITETIKHEIKKQESRFLSCFNSAISNFFSGISGRGARRARRG